VTQLTELQRSTGAADAVWTGDHWLLVWTFDRAGESGLEFAPLLNSGELGQVFTESTRKISPDFHAIAATWDGKNALILWNDAIGLKGTRINAIGQPLDSSPPNVGFRIVDSAASASLASLGTGSAMMFYGRRIPDPPYWGAGRGFVRIINDDL
jgi:hypothetical protein